MILHRFAILRHISILKKHTITIKTTILPYIFMTVPMQVSGVLDKTLSSTVPHEQCEIRDSMKGNREIWDAVVSEAVSLHCCFSLQTNKSSHNLPDREQAESHSRQQHHLPHQQRHHLHQQSHHTVRQHTHTPHGFIRR